MKSINKDEFFKQVAINSGVTDLETVRNVFYGMVKTISRELKDRHIVKLPDWGEFYIQIRKARTITDVNNRNQIAIPAKPTVKFNPDYKVKRYFYQLGE